MTHVTDEQIQNYLEGNLPHDHLADFEQHIERCPKCQTELAHYRRLYEELKDEAGISLSPNFVNTVMKTVQVEANRASLARWWNILLPLIGIAVGLTMMIYYVDFKPFTKVFIENLNPARYFDSAVLSNLNQILTRINVNLNLIVFAALSLLAVILIDHLISRHKEKLFSYLKMLPVF